MRPASTTARVLVVLLVLVPLLRCAEQTQQGDEAPPEAVAVQTKPPDQFSRPPGQQPTSFSIPPQSLIDEGIELSEMGRHEEAIRRFEMAALRAEDSRAALINKAVALSKLRRFKEATETLETPSLAEDAEAQESLDRLRSRPEAGTAEAGVVILASHDDPQFDVTWVMAVEAWDDGYDFEQNGKRFMKVGTSRTLHEKERDLLSNESESLGLVYTGAGASAIEGAREISPEQLGISSPIATKLLFLHVGDRFHPAYTVVSQNIESGLFRWAHTTNGTEHEFAADEVVPSGFMPITSLRLAEIPGMDGVDAVPQLNARGVQELQRWSQHRVRLLGIAMLNRWKQALVLAASADVREGAHERGRVVFHGNGRWRWDNGNVRDPNAVDVVVVGQADMGPVFVDPFEAPIWTFRRERIHDHQMF